MAASVDPEQIDQIPNLLHDAKFLNFRWDKWLCRIEIDFYGLRCDENGKTIERPITLQLQNVIGIAAFNRIPRCLSGEKPKFKITRMVTAHQLEDWDESSQFWLRINSRHGRVEFDTALQVEWLLGSNNDHGDVTIHFGASMGSLQIVCDAITVHDNGQAMAVDQWSEQYGNWWKAWQNHWDDRNDSEGPHASQFETAIPAAPDVKPSIIPDPLDRIVFPKELDAPDELLQPICDYLEGVQQRDWLRAARAFPCLDTPDEHHAEGLADNHECGPWLYAREIDQWWSEENYACVTVRAIEYEPDSDDDPASAMETVVSYELRKFEGRWIIWNWSQGWVEYGSAPAVKCRRPWHDEWSVPSHRSSRGSNLIAGTQKIGPEYVFAIMIIGALAWMNWPG